MNLLSITKPGIIFGNIITVCGGYFLGSQDGFALFPLIIVVIGMSLVMASGCVMNNIIDSDIDRLMERTKNRALATGLVSRKTALVFGVLLGLIGIGLLYIWTNLLSTLIALVAWLVYVISYSLYMKRKSVYGTIIGGIAGAAPPVIGYCAAANRFDMGAVAVFFILFLWQIPHSYAIAVYRLKDYTAAAIPVLPVKKGIYYTKITMLVYIVVFTIAAIMPTVLGYSGTAYFIVALVAGLCWLYLGIQGLMTDDNRRWARKMFIYSIFNITLLCVMMAVG
ncbi:MAG: heme o synthase [Pseudomonadota bacterium]